MDLDHNVMAFRQRLSEFDYLCVRIIGSIAATSSRSLQPNYPSHL